MHRIVMDFWPRGLKIVLGFITTCSMWCPMVVSGFIHEALLKSGYLQIKQLNGFFHDKPPFLGYLHLWNPRYL